MMLVTCGTLATETKKTQSDMGHEVLGSATIRMLGKWLKSRVSRQNGLPGGLEILEPEGRKNLAGNNPMVGATVAVAVAVQEAMTK